MFTNKTELTKKQKQEIVELANDPSTKNVGNYGKYGNSFRLIRLLENMGYLEKMSELEDTSYSYTMDNVECYFQKSRRSDFKSKVVMIKQAQPGWKVVDFEILN